MEHVSLREANIHFSKYVKKVKAGEEIVLTDRGKPVALMKPFPASKDPVEERLLLMEKKGLLCRSRAGRVRLRKLVRLNGKSISKIIEENREERV
jgi:antitoxin (DNA-binding transcriptional repressor) of toxin-antitoxin stability system